MAEDKKRDDRYPEIETVEYIYNGSENDFIGFLKAIISDYLSADSITAAQEEGEKKENESA